MKEIICRFEILLERISLRRSKSKLEPRTLNLLPSALGKLKQLFRFSKLKAFPLARCLIWMIEEFRDAR